MDKEFFTVAEFAEIVGVSKQAIYKRIPKDLEPYVKQENGTRYISRSALRLFETIGAKKEENDYVLFLQEQLKTRDKQIADLQAHLIEQSKLLTDIVAKQNDLANNYQVLLAKFYDGKPAIPSKTEDETPVEPVEKQLFNVEQQVEQPVEQKQGFFRKLLRKNKPGR